MTQKYSLWGILSICLIVMLSCGHLNKRDQWNELDDSVPKTSQYNFVDSTGTYLLTREVGTLVKNKKKQIYLRSLLLPENADATQTDKALEKVLTFAELSEEESSEGKVPVLVPLVSQFSIWFEGQKYFSQILLSHEKKQMEVTLVSPEAKWKGTKTYDLPANKHVYCFYSQIPECVKTTGFLELSSKKKAGKMTFYLIWDRYPYIQEHYLNIPDDIISIAAFSYDGVEEGVTKYVLKVGEHSLFYHFDKKFDYLKKFWVAQGITQTKL